MRGDLASSLNQTEMIHLYRRSRVGWCIIPKRAICKDPGRVPSPKSHFHAVVCAASLQVPSAIMQRAEAILGGQFGSRANLCLRRSEKWISQQVSRQIADDAGGGHQTALHRAAPTRFAPLAQRWLGRCSVTGLVLNLGAAGRDEPKHYTGPSADPSFGSTSKRV